MVNATVIIDAGPLVALTHERDQLSYADACLVRMVELQPDGLIFTTDSDFNIYRQHRNEVIPLVIPPQK
jgi:hypothetical protein